MQCSAGQYLSLMSIMTRTGDDGTTGLLSDERLPKDDVRIEAYGTVDELSSFLGAARHVCVLPEIGSAIEEIQKTLFRVAGELASPGIPFDGSIDDADEAMVAAKTAAIEEKIPLRGFVIPGTTPGSAALDIARTVARRAERRIVALAREAEVSVPLRNYMNRLSDYLFMLARAEETAAGMLQYVH
jgi:cob(I)alamin adenosyltransferase